MKFFIITILLILSLALCSCNTVAGFTKGVVDDIRSLVPGI